MDAPRRQEAEMPFCEAVKVKSVNSGERPQDAGDASHELSAKESCAQSRTSPGKTYITGSAAGGTKLSGPSKSPDMDRELEESHLLSWVLLCWFSIS